MANFMSHVAVPIAIGAVAIVLLLGLVNMMMGGSREHLAEADAAARLAAGHRHWRHHADAVVHGKMSGAAPWSSSTRSTPAPAMTARPRSAPASGARNTTCASQPTAPSTRPTPRSAWRGCTPLDDAELDAALARIQNDLFDVGADLCTPGKGKGPGGARLTVTDETGRMARSRDRPAQCGAGAAALLRAAGRQRGRGASACRPHRLPARRAADRRAQGPTGRKRVVRGPQIRQPPLRFPFRRKPLRQRPRCAATCFGSRARTASGVDRPRAGR